MLLIYASTGNFGTAGTVPPLPLPLHPSRICLAQNTEPQ